MKNFTRIVYLSIVFLSFMGGAQAQTPSDAMMMKQRESCFALTYDHGTFDQYWEGTYLRKNATIATVTRNTVVPMIAIGLHDRLNFYVAAPYIQTKSSEINGGKLAGVKAFQDLSFALKFQAINKEVGKGDVTLHATVGYSTPLTNYLSDYRPYSLGFGANEFSYRGIVQYKLDNGFYVRLAGAYLWRGYTKAERDYYYNNGSYYTPWMDVPSAWEYNGVVGKWFFDNTFKLEASYYAMKSTSGDDIRKYNAAQATNKVNVDQVIFSTQYYFKQIKGFGLLAYYAQVIGGRNVGKATNFGVGGTYQFKI